ncbi:unnamed protein product [Closterium sp. NIES-53]
MFRVWGSRAFVRDTSTDKLSARAIPCVFLGFVPKALGWQFYHPTSRRVLPSQAVTSSYGRPPPEGPDPSGVSQVDPPLGAVPGAASSGGSAGASPRLSLQQVREWLVQRACLWSGATRAGGAGAAGAGGAGVLVGAGVPGGIATTGPGGARTRGTGTAGTGGVGGAGAGDLTESGAACYSHNRLECA